jgi:hypothetical protein
MSNLIYNQITQPDDHVPVKDQWMRVGPYDRWAIAWAYRPIPTAPTAEAELPTLERWRSAQDTAAYLRISALGVEGDLNAMGGDDLLKATELQAQNSARIWRRRLTMDSAATLRAVTEMSPQWQAKLLDIAQLIGGREAQPPYPRDPAAIRFVPLAAGRQLQAMRLVLAYVVYGQIPLVQWLDSRTKHSSVPRYQSAADSVPMLFDTTSTSRFPGAAGWVQMQQTVLAALISSLPKLPPAAQVDACQYLSDAVRAVTNAESTAASAQKKEARTLHTVLTSAFMRPNICSSSNTISP